MDGFLFCATNSGCRQLNKYHNLIEMLNEKGHDVPDMVFDENYYTGVLAAPKAACIDTTQQTQEQVLRLGVDTDREVHVLDDAIGKDRNPIACFMSCQTASVGHGEQTQQDLPGNHPSTAPPHAANGEYVGGQGFLDLTPAWPEGLNDATGMPLHGPANGVAQFQYANYVFKVSDDDLWKCSSEESLARARLFSEIKALRRDLLYAKHRPFRVNDLTAQDKFVRSMAAFERVVGQGSNKKGVKLDHKTTISGLISYAATKLAHVGGPAGGTTIYNDLDARQVAAVMNYTAFATVESIRGQLVGEQPAMKTVQPETLSGHYMRIGGAPAIDLRYNFGDNASAANGGNPSYLTQVQALGEGTKVLFDTAFEVAKDAFQVGDELVGYGHPKEVVYAAGAQNGAGPEPGPTTHTYAGRPQDYIGNAITNMWEHTVGGVKQTVIEFERPWVHHDGAIFGVMKKKDTTPVGVKYEPGPGRAWCRYTAAQEAAALPLPNRDFGDATVEGRDKEVFSKRVSKVAAPFYAIHWDEWLKLQDEIATKRRVNEWTAANQGPGVHMYSIKGGEFSEPLLDQAGQPIIGTDAGLELSPFDRDTNGWVQGNGAAQMAPDAHLNPLNHVRSITSENFQNSIDMLASLTPLFIRNKKARGSISDLTLWNIGRFAHIMEMNGSQLLVIGGDDLDGKGGTPFSSNAQTAIPNQRGRPLDGGLAGEDGSIIVQMVQPASCWPGDPMLMRALCNSTDDFNDISSGLVNAEICNPFSRGFDENSEVRVPIKRWDAGDNLVAMFNMLYLEPRAVYDDPGLDNVENYLDLVTDAVDPTSPHYDWIMSMVEPGYNLQGTSSQAPGAMAKFGNRHVFNQPIPHNGITICRVMLRLWSTWGWAAVQKSLGLSHLNLEKVIPMLDVIRSLETPPRQSRNRNGQITRSLGLDGSIGSITDGTVKYSQDTLLGAPVDVTRNAAGDPVLGLATSGTAEGWMESLETLREVDATGKFWSSVDQPVDPSMSKMPTMSFRRFTNGEWGMQLKTATNFLDTEYIRPLEMPYRDMIRPDLQRSIFSIYEAQWGIQANKVARGGAVAGTASPQESFPGFDLVPAVAGPGGLPSHFDLGAQARGDITATVAGLRAPSAQWEDIQKVVSFLEMFQMCLIINPGLDLALWDYCVALTGGETLNGGDVVGAVDLPRELNPVMTTSVHARRRIEYIPASERFSREVRWNAEERTMIEKEALGIAQLHGTDDPVHRERPGLGLAYSRPQAPVNVHSIRSYWKVPGGAPVMHLTDYRQRLVVPGTNLTAALVQQNLTAWQSKIARSSYGPPIWNYLGVDIPSLRVRHSPFPNCLAEFAVASLLLPPSASSSYAAPSGTVAYQSYHPMSSGRPIHLPSALSLGGAESEALLLNEFRLNPRILGQAIVPAEYSKRQLALRSAPSGDPEWRMDTVWKPRSTGKRIGADSTDQKEKDDEQGKAAGASTTAEAPAPQ